MPAIHLRVPRIVSRIEARSLSGWPRSVVHGTVFLLAIAVAVLSYRYLLGLGPVPPIIAANRFHAAWLVLHVGFASTALLVGVSSSAADCVGDCPACTAGSVGSTPRPA